MLSLALFFAVTPPFLPTLAHADLVTDAALRPRAELARARLTADLLQTQLPDGSWDGPFEGDPSTDGMMLMLAAQLGRLTPTLIQESVDRIFASPLYRTDGTWAAYLGGPASPEVTAAILFGLQAAGLPREDARLERAWEFYRNRGGIKQLHLMFRMLLTVLGGAERQSLPYLSPKFLALPRLSPVNFFNLGLARTALVPMLVWSHYRDRQDRGDSAERLDEERIHSAGARFGDPTASLFKLDGLPSLQIPFLDRLFGPQLESASSVEELIHRTMTWADRLTPGSSQFWAQEALGWLLHTTQADGTWAGVFQSTALTLLALQAAQEMNVADFSQEIERAWTGLLGWRRTLPSGHRFQQFSEGPIMESARILTAFQAAGPRSMARLATHASEQRLIRYLMDKQIQTPGDWSYRQPDLSPGGWAYQKFNDRYPDIDDTAMVLEGLAGQPNPSRELQASIAQGAHWMLGMQNRDGGFAAWEKDTPRFLQKLFGMSQGMDVVIDPSEADVTARVIRALVVLRRAGLPGVDSAGLAQSLRRACRWLISKAEWENGAPVWVGDWAINRVYATAEATTALVESGCWSVEEAAPSVEWLVNRQNSDGGWGESPEGYLQKRFVSAPSTTDLTGFALHALLVYREHAPELAQLELLRAVENGVAYLTHRVETRRSPEMEEGMGATLFKGVVYGRYIHLPQYEALRSLNRALR